MLWCAISTLQKISIYVFPKIPFHAPLPNIFKRNDEIAVVFLWRRFIFLDKNYKDGSLKIANTI
jgi:hypothetical protein